MNLLGWILDPLQYGFMQRALMAAVLVGIICPVVGSYMILRGMSFFGDALSHSILPGIVIAYLLSLSVLLGALIAGLIAALAIGFISQRGRVRARCRADQHGAGLHGRPDAYPIW
jgi:ABC-type Mn2+/Zn2+ transport system permease subunit